MQFAEIAQLVEHNLAKVGVASSSLVFRSRNAEDNRKVVLCVFQCIEVRTNDPVSRLSRCGSINKSLRNYLSKRWFEFYFLLHKKMVYYSGEELMLLRDSKYIIRRDTDKFREFLRKWRVRCSCLTRQWKDFWQ